MQSVVPHHNKQSNVVDRGHAVTVRTPGALRLSNKDVCAVELFMQLYLASSDFRWKSEWFTLDTLIARSHVVA